MRPDASLLKSIIRIAKKAEEAVLALYHTQAPLNIEFKSDNSPVTLADLKAHEIIQEGLSALTPGIPILSEEGDNPPFETRNTWDLFWLVDSLDGTREFIQRTGQFTLNIALVSHFAPILGVIVVPLKETVYYAAKELGAFRQTGGGLASPLRIKQWTQGKDLTLVTTRKELQEDIQTLLTAQSQLKMTYRSSSLKFCLIAEGGADIYLRKKPIHEWDTAAGQCIVESAGGLVLDSNWNTLRYNTKTHLLNPPFIALGDSKQLLPMLKTMPIFKEIQE